jgi:hypothetical protein
MEHHIPNRVRNAVRNALIACHNKHNSKHEDGLRFALHIMGYVPNEGYVFRVVVCRLKDERAIAQDLMGDLSRNTVLPMLEVMAKEYWKVKDKH